MVKIMFKGGPWTGRRGHKHTLGFLGTEGNYTQVHAHLLCPFWLLWLLIKTKIKNKNKGTDKYLQKHKTWKLPRSVKPRLCPHHSRAPTSVFWYIFPSFLSNKDLRKCGLQCPHSQDALSLEMSPKDTFQACSPKRLEESIERPWHMMGEGQIGSVSYCRKPQESWSPSPTPHTN